jgi:DNA-binding transcriptional LysR family regulator
MALLLEDIKYFIQVSDTLNMTRASEIIGISQPALSYAIKKLEKKIGGTLFIRTKNGLHLTKLGEEFKKKSYRLLFEWENLENIIHPESGLTQATYTLAIHPSVALSTIQYFMPNIQALFPRLSFHFLHGLSREMTEKVVSFEADLGIVVNPIQHPDLVIKKLFNDEVTIFHTESADHRLIYDQKLLQSEAILKSLSSDMRFKTFINSPNLEVVAKLTALGLGYGILPTKIASQYFNLQKRIDSPVFQDDICLIYRPEKMQDSVSQKIIQMIRLLLPSL